MGQPATDQKLQGCGAKQTPSLLKLIAWGILSYDGKKTNTGGGGGHMKGLLSFWYSTSDVASPIFFEDGNKEKWSGYETGDTNIYLVPPGCFH